MLIRGSALAALIAMFLLPLQAAEARVEEECADVLIPEYESKDSTFDEFMSFASLATKLNWDTARKKLINDFEYTDPSLGITNETEYEDFKKRYEELVRSSNFVTSKSESVSFLSQKLDDQAYDAFILCMRIKGGLGGTESNRHDGFFILPISVNESRAKIDLYWSPLGGEGSPPDVKVINAEGVKDGIPEIPTIESSGTYYTMIFERVYGENLIIDFSATPYPSITLEFNASPKIDTPCDLESLNDTIAIRKWRGSEPFDKYTDSGTFVGTFMLDQFYDIEIDAACILNVVKGNDMAFTDVDDSGNLSGHQFRLIHYRDRSGREGSIQSYDICRQVVNKVDDAGIEVPSNFCVGE